MILGDGVDGGADAFCACQRKGMEEAGGELGRHDRREQRQEDGQERAATRRTQRICRHAELWSCTFEPPFISYRRIGSCHRRCASSLTSPVRVFLRHGKKRVSRGAEEPRRRPQFLTAHRESRSPSPRWQGRACRRCRSTLTRACETRICRGPVTSRTTQLEFGYIKSNLKP